MKNLLKIVTSFFSSEIKSKFFSQDGEDFYMSKIIDFKKPGFYIDIGAADPIHANNTYWFYLRGWRGLCIDASPGWESLYKKHRPKDTFINSFIGKKRMHRKLYLFDEPFLNTGSAKRKDFLLQKTKYKLQNEVYVPQQPLREIVKNHCGNKKIDFISLDVEESELEVLESNDWTLFRPRFIIMEVLTQDRGKIGEQKSTKYLKKLGYRPTAIFPRSVFFDNS